MTTMERIALYVVVLALVIGAGFLVWQMREFKSAFEEFGKTVTSALDAKFADLEHRVLDDVASRMEKEIADSHGDLMTALDGIDEALAETVDGKLAGLEGRVAGSVYKRLSEGICALRNAECGQDTGCAAPCRPPGAPGEECVAQCSDGPPPMSVESMFTFLFGNARLNERGEVAEDSFGIRLTPEHAARLHLLADAFRPCQRGEDLVQFHVTGFSSTAEFRAGPEDERLADSDALNLKTANLRADVVRRYLQAQGFQATVEPWRSFDSLRRPYFDDFQTETDQQALNRSVFIKVESAGACDRGEIERSAR